MREVNNVNDRYRVPKPQGVKEVPKYLWTLLSTFCSRLFYIFQLVWETKKSLLFWMIFMAAFNGVMPVIGSLIGAQIMNRLADAYAASQNGTAFAFSIIAVLLVLQFFYTFVNNSISRLYALVTSFSGEQLSNHVKMKIMAKAKEVDMMSFDSPDFYARMENANREAGMRPLQIMSATFTVLSTLISIVSYVIVLFAASWWAPIVIVLVSIPTTIVTFVYRKKNVAYLNFRSKNRRQMEYYAGTSGRYVHGKVSGSVFRILQRLKEAAHRRMSLRARHSASDQRGLLSALYLPGARCIPWQFPGRRLFAVYRRNYRNQRGRDVADLRNLCHL